MSSTTERRTAESGQILILFVGGLLAICAIAALVFDVGQNLLDRRTEQNAADAAALAGARYVVGATDIYHGGCAGAPATIKVVKAACDSAAANGFVDGANQKTVRVDFPPVLPSLFSGLPQHVEVTIGSTRPSFFQGILGVAQQRVGATSVATNQSDIALPYSLLALDPNPGDCGKNKITGSAGAGVTINNGSVHVDSPCTPDALLLAGHGALSAPECDVVGGIQTQGGAINSCTSAPIGVLTSGDPLRSLPAPAQPGPPAPVQALNGGPNPSGCPGLSSPATDSSPQACKFNLNGMVGYSYRIFPGNYPGGIQINKGTVYMSPGIYWIGGGGIQVQTDGVLVSKADGDNTGTTPSGGVLVYNTADPNPTIAAGCVTAPTGAGCYDDIVLNGGTGATLALVPIQSGPYTNMVIFVDRTKSKPDDIYLNGAGSTLDISGTVYAPNGTVKLNGSSSNAVSAQIICWTFQVNGSTSALTINYDADQLFHLKGVGLVE